MSLLRNSPYKIVPHQELTDADADRICTLYQMLFVDKHSKFNPDLYEKIFSSSNSTGGGIITRRCVALMAALMGLLAGFTVRVL